MVLAAVVYCFLAQTINEFEYNGGVMKNILFGCLFLQFMRFSRWAGLAQAS